jgi:hypothetical protein
MLKATQMGLIDKDCPHLRTPETRKYCKYVNKNSVHLNINLPNQTEHTYFVKLTLKHIE